MTKSDKSNHEQFIFTSAKKFEKIIAKNICHMVIICCYVEIILHNRKYFTENHLIADPKQLPTFLSRKQGFEIGGESILKFFRVIRHIPV